MEEKWLFGTMFHGTERNGNIERGAGVPSRNRDYVNPLNREAGPRGEQEQV